MVRPRTKTSASLRVDGDVFRNSVCEDQITRCELSGRFKMNDLLLILMSLATPRNTIAWR